MNDEKQPNCNDTEITHDGKPEAIQNFVHNLHQIKNQLTTSDSLTGVDFNKYLFTKYFQNVANECCDAQWDEGRRKNVELWAAVMHKHRRIGKICFYIFTICMVFYLVNCYKYEASSIFMTNIQNYIYPGMSAWRRLTLPIIQTFPGLTELYDESCLVKNPFFQIKDLDCKPCMDVVNVLDLTNVPNHTESVPYIFKTHSEPIDLKLLQKLYYTHRQIFQQDAHKVQSTNSNIKNLENLFEDYLNETSKTIRNKNKDNSFWWHLKDSLHVASTNTESLTKQLESHSLWRCNRMNPARILRTLIKRPNRLPKTGQCIERYLSFDTASGPAYYIPDLDCSNIFIYQLKGVRTIILRPTIECQHKCRTLTIRLPESYVLNYDWWYWKPISLPDHHTKSPSISYIGAYC